MVPLLDRIIAEWTALDASTTSPLPGSEIALPDHVTSVQRPDGVREPVTPRSRYRFGMEAGVYHLSSADSTIAALAVNPAALESDLTRMSERRVRELFANGDPIVSDRASDWADSIYRGRLGREVWRPFLIVVLILLFVEALVAATGVSRRKESRPTQPGETQPVRSAKPSAASRA
jgi:hypothetical protein